MKIALALESFDPARGGLECWTWQFTRALVALGHEVHVVASDFAVGAADTGAILHMLTRAGSPLLRAESMEKCLRGLDADIVHDMGVGWYGDIIHPHGGSTRAWREHNLLRIPRWRRIPICFEKRYREQREIERRQHASAALIVAVSQMTKRHFMEKHGLAESRLRVIYNGVDCDRFHPGTSSRESNEVTFLLVAHNLALKNAATAIRALALLRGEGHSARLIIAGTHRTRRTERLAKKLAVREAVDFLGPVQDATKLYAAADVCLHPTWYDPCSLVTLEAWASGLPVITTHYNGAAELMRDEVHGCILQDPADAIALAGRMKDLLNPMARAPMSASARNLALNHTDTLNIQEFLSLYSELRQ